MADHRYRRRTLEATLRRVSEQFPVVMLTGPRQVGKTTLLRHLSGVGRRYVSLDDSAVRDLARTDPRLFLQRFPAPVLIDEFQYAPEILPLIKLAVDAERTPGAYWLTGSQLFEGMQGVSESLAGRVAILKMLGFSWRETWQASPDTPPFLPTEERVAERGVADPAYDRETLAEAVWAGGFPEPTIAGDERRDLWMASYVQTYLHHDVRDFARIGDLGTFDRFLRAAAARTGQLLNLSNLARDVDISVPTAKAWLAILVASFQVYLLRPFHANVTKRLVKAPKLYFLDTGLACHLTGWTSPESAISGAAAGALVETWALGEVLKSWWHCGLEPPLFHYRDKDRREVDFLFDLDGALHPVEVKLAATVKRDWLRGIQPIDRLRAVPRGEGAVLCLTPDAIPLDARTTALPFGAL